MSKSRNLGSLLFAGVAAIALTACGEGAVPGDGGARTQASGKVITPDYSAIATAAITNPERPEADRADDARRKPAKALEFFQVAPGMTVFEIEAGGGWYTELLSHAVGADGAVIMQNPEGFLRFVGEQIEMRFDGDRLPNVRRSLSNFDAFDAEDGSVNLVTWVQGPHELYYKPDDGSDLGDPATSYAEIFRILKPGGAFAVIDHSAEAGAPETSGNDLHRIDKAIVVRMAESAGLVLEAEEDFLANPGDTLLNSVFDQAIRGNTSQFVLRFRKPA